jgi:hypothetical protein
MELLEQIEGLLDPSETAVSAAPQRAIATIRESCGKESNLINPVSARCSNPAQSTGILRIV